MLLRRVCRIALTTGLLGLTACGTTRHDNPQERIVVETVAAVLLPDRPPRALPAADVKGALTALAHVQARWIGAIAPPPTVPASTAPHSAAPAPAAMDVAAVMACIRDHESGDYTNHSNGPEGASGAYQYVGSTWRAWSARAGFGGYSAAWQAPPATQDAVTVYTLTHGGAGNWSPRFGDDPCTVGFGG